VRGKQTRVLANKILPSEIEDTVLEKKKQLLGQLKCEDTRVLEKNKKKLIHQEI